MEQTGIGGLRSWLGGPKLGGMDNASETYRAGAEIVSATHRDEGWTCNVGQCRVNVGHEVSRMDAHLDECHGPTSADSIFPKAG